MTYYNDYEILNEADEQQKPNISPEGFNQIMDDYVARDRQRANLSVKLKLTHSLFDAIEFPPVPANFANLMTKSYFPEKFLNVNNALDPDPSATIDNATDFAYKCFSGIGTLSLAPKNESIEFNDSKILNEGLGSWAFSVGKVAGVATSQILGGGIAGVATGVAQTVGAPMAAAAGAAAGLGALAARLSPDSAGNYHENDKKLLQKSGLSQNNGKISRNKDAIQAIDNYISSVNRIMQTLLTQVASKNSKTNIAKLLTLVNKLNAGALSETTDWIDAHREEIVKFSEHRANKDRENLNAMESINIRLEKWLKFMMENPNISPDVKKELRNTLTVSTRKKADALDDVYDKVKPTNNVNASYNIDYKKQLTLNEDDNNANISSEKTENDVKLPEFNADVIYETVLRNIQEAVNQVLEVDKEEWPKVIWAKERMQELKKGATEQINKQIEIVCRMSNGENMPKGLSGTVTDFIVKHPMRAENLKALWKRHESDLDLRIQRRIDAITNPTGPCEAVYTFIQTTYPALMAMMITYKALLAFMRENDSTLMRPMDDTYLKNMQEEKTLVKNTMLNNFKLAYDLAGGYLNKTPGEQTIVYDVLKNIFTADLNYGGAIVYQMLKQNKRKDVAQQYSVYVDNFDELLPKNADTYFNKMGCVLSSCGKVEDATNVSKLIKLLEAVGAEKEQMQKVIEKINASKEKIKSHRSEHLNNLLKLILATRGEFINYYKKCGGGADEKQWKDIKALMNENYIYSFQHKDNKGNLNKKDKQDTKHDVTKILAKYDQALAKEGFDIKTLIDSVNQEEYFNVIFNVYYNCFFINILTNVEGKPNLTYIDYDVLITILDMMSSNLPKLVSSEMDMDMTKLNEYALGVQKIVNNGYEPNSDEEFLFGYPGVKSSEIEKYDEITNILNDKIELTEDDSKNQNNGAQEQFSFTLKDVLNSAWTLPEKLNKAGIKIDDKYKLDVSNEYVLMLIERCRIKDDEDEKTYHGFYDFIVNNINRYNFKNAGNADEMLDQIRIIFHNAIIYAYYQFGKNVQSRIDFDSFWNNKIQTIKTADKTLNLTLEQICRMVNQVQTWLNSKTQTDNGGSKTKQLYDELKNRCNEKFKDMFGVSFDFSKFGELKDFTSVEFKNNLGTDADKIISALMEMFSDINNTDKIFQSYFSCVCWQDSNSSSEETETTEQELTSEQK